jgi:hypothetical protein
MTVFKDKDGDQVTVHAAVATDGLFVSVDQRNISTGVRNISSAILLPKEAIGLRDLLIEMYPIAKGETSVSCRSNMFSHKDASCDVVGFEYSETTSNLYVNVNSGTQVRFHPSEVPALKDFLESKYPTSIATAPVTLSAVGEMVEFACPQGITINIANLTINGAV